MQFQAFYVKEFPIQKITDLGTSGWHGDPSHTRNRYRFEDAILEHIDNTFCEPIQITMRTEKQVSVGPSGVVRLHALVTKRNWQTIPAIVSTSFIPEWLDTSTEIKTVDELLSYYRLEPKNCGFETDGRVFHHNENPNPDQLEKTFVVSEETKERILSMLREEVDV